MGRKSVDYNYDEESGQSSRNEQSGTSSNNKWGRGGISVSADEGVLDAPKRKRGVDRDSESQPLADPAAFEDDESDDDSPPAAAAGSSAAVVHESGVRGDEWNDDVDDDAKPHDGIAK